MQATFVTFPGSMRRITADGEGKTTLQAFLEAAGEAFTPGDKNDYAVNGEITTDPATEVPEGATVTKTARVQGG